MFSEKKLRYEEGIIPNIHLLYKYLSKMLAIISKMPNISVMFWCSC
jgi:hypothetical protein